MGYSKLFHMLIRYDRPIEEGWFDIHALHAFVLEGIIVAMVDALSKIHHLWISLRPENEIPLETININVAWM